MRRNLSAIFGMRARLFCLLLAAIFAGKLGNFAAETPKLVVTIVVDQLRYDYLERAPEKFANEGFRLLTERGAFMTFARYNYFPTVTGPGHASYLSGSPPGVHGIIGNDWYDKRAGKDQYCCGDTNVVAVGTTNKSAMSPRNFVGSTVADQMRMHFNSKVVSVSMKDRGAILPAGKKPHGAFWFESKSGNFITSTYYMTNLPQWVTDFNDRKLATNFIGKIWERVHEEREYRFTDEHRGEGKLKGETNSVFNHTIHSSTNGYDTVYGSPYGDELLTQFAIAALDAEQLGQELGRPDMLCVSYSSMDSIGHTFGPESHEIQDETFRIDRQLEKLFRHIDEKVGLANVFIILTSDHGVAPTPEFAKDMGLDGERWNTGKFMTNLQTHLESKFGTGKYFATKAFHYGTLFLNHDTLREKQLTMAAVASVIREYALDSGWFMNVFSRDQLLDGRAPGQIGQLYANGYNPERGGDIMLVSKPYKLGSTDKTGTSHSTVYSYDTRIPILFFGSGFKAGRYSDEFYITDIAATLCAALRITEPAGSIGKPCVRILVE